MTMMRLRELISLACVFGCLTVGTNQRASAAVSLSDLISTSGSVVVGGSLVFDQFSYAATNESAPADRVLIDSVTDGLGNVGIRIHGGFSDSPGGGDSTALLNYRVSTLNPSSVLSGAQLAGNPAAVGIGSYTVNESLSGVPTALSIFDISPGNNTKLLDSLSLPSVLSSLNVALSLTGSSQTAGVTLSFLDQTFAQTDAVVPEPASWVIWMGTLMLFGIVVPLSHRHWQVRSLKKVTVRR